MNTVKVTIEAKGSDGSSISKTISITYAEWDDYKITPLGVIESKINQAFAFILED